MTPTLQPHHSPNATPPMTNTNSAKCQSSSTKARSKHISPVNHSPDRKVHKKDCEHCGASFETYFPKQKYCGRICQNKVRYQRTLISNQGRRKRILYEKTCEVCGTPFKSHNNRKKTCSAKCRDYLKAIAGGAVVPRPLPPEERKPTPSAPKYQLDNWGNIIQKKEPKRDPFLHGPYWNTVL